MEILKQVTDDIFLVKLTKEPKIGITENSVMVAHDYVLFNTIQNISFSIDNQDTAFGKYAVCRNNIHYKASVQIGIREMIQIVLPYLQNHKYMQKEHIGKRTTDSGEEYFPYCYNGTSTVRYFNDNVAMIALREGNTDEWKHITEEEFLENVYPSILEKYLEKYPKVKERLSK